MARPGAQLRSAGRSEDGGGIAVAANRTNGGAICGPLKMQTPERQPLRRAKPDWKLALSLTTRTQNAPSNMAPTNANTANTASTLSLNARSTSHLLRVEISL